MDEWASRPAEYMNLSEMRCSFAEANTLREHLQARLSLFPFQFLEVSVCRANLYFQYHRWLKRLHYHAIASAEAHAVVGVDKAFTASELNAIGDVVSFEFFGQNGATESVAVFLGDTF